MKLRIKGNSLRLRLLQSEVNQIAEGQKVVETTQFNFKQKMTYTLAVSDNINEPKAEFSKGGIRVWLPVEMVKIWTNSNQVSIEAYQEVGNDEKLYILIEKDFKCLDAQELEDQSDNFPNPKEGGIAC